MKSKLMLLLVVLTSGIQATTTLGDMGYLHEGSIVGWGNNSYGQTNVPAGNDFTQVAAGGEYSLALKSDGSLAGWGWNSYGQTNVPAGNDFTQVAAGIFHSLALKSDGSLAGWGYNLYGQTNVPPGNDFTQVAAGMFHSLALKSDGSLAAWGLKSWGQTNVPAGNDFTQVAAGGAHSLALKSDGSIVGWGSNVDGQTNVPAGNNFTQITAGWIHSLALKARDSYEDLLIQDVDSFTKNDTLLQRQVSVSGDVTINGLMDWMGPTGSLSVGGHVSILGGSKLSVLLGDLQPGLGQSFQLFAASWPIMGQFDALHLPTLGQGLTWDTTHLYDSGRLSVVPAPGAGLLGTIGLLYSGWRLRRRTT